MRLLAAVGVVAGVVHLLAPGRLLALARSGYDHVLAVDFEPRENATRRVRLVGLGLLGAALAVLVGS